MRILPALLASAALLGAAPAVAQEVSERVKQTCRSVSSQTARTIVYALSVAVDGETFGHHEPFGDMCIAAFGGEINFWTLLAYNIFIGTIASLVRRPRWRNRGFVGRDVGRSRRGRRTHRDRRAAVLANQLVANFIPAVPGWFATNNLMRDDYL